MKKKNSNIAILCPNCGSKRTNEVSKQNRYCVECLKEFSVKTKQVYSIIYHDGKLVDHFVSEFENCG